MGIDSRAGRKIADFARSDLVPGIKLDAGPFIGKIKNTYDPARLGRLQVYVPELSAGDEEDPLNWKTVTYCSPFFGTTVPTGKTSTQNEYGYAKESYGFWMTPPDVGTLVICIFIKGKPDKGYYIGCIPDETSHHMVPGLSGSAAAKTSSLPEDLIKKADGATYLPVTEFNDNAVDLAKTPDIYYSVERPVHQEQLGNLARQGLIGDRVRGVISSSSQRESPSNVFGFSTPGRVIANDQNNPDIVNQRAGGHSLVFDDGDSSGRDNLVRLRSSAGHQIMMNDSAGIIYIISSSGKNWIEMGADGSVRVYAEKDITMRAEGAINFVSDSSFNVNAPAINLKGTSVNVEASADFNLFAGANITHKSGNKVAIGGTRIEMSGTSAAISFTGELGLVGDKIKLNCSPSATVNAPPKLNDIDILPTFEPWLKRPDGTALEEDAELAVSEAPAPRPAAAPAQPIKPVIPPGSGSLPNLAAAIAAQPEPGAAIGTLTKEQTKALLASIGLSESGGAYDKQNSIGYSGKYQFGVAALEDLGYIKKGTWATYGKNLVLQNPAVWTGKDGINSQQDWFNSPAIQEQVMEKNTQNNFKQLQKMGTINKSTTPGEVAGLLKVAHLLGAGGAKKWASGGGGSDAFGTSGDKYFAQGRSAVDNVA